MSQTVMVVAEDVPEHTLIANALQKKLAYNVIPIRSHGSGLALPTGSAEDMANADVVLIDTVSKSNEISRTIQQVKKARPDLPLVVLASASFDGVASHLIAAGADDVLIRPVTLERLRISLNAQIQIYSLKRRLQLMTPYASQTEGFPAILFRNDAMQLAMAWARAWGQQDEPVWIDGEMGVGKTMLARAIHRASSRNHADFLTVSSETLVSNLRAIVTFCEQASGGTLVIDNPLNCAKNRVQNLISSLLAASQKYNTRIVIAQTFPCDSTQAMEWMTGLGVRCRVTLPPLRERGEDRLLLAQHFIRKYALTEGMAPGDLLPEAKSWIESHHWQGNIRELAHCMFHAVSSCDSKALTAAQLEGAMAVVGRRSYTSSGQLFAINLLCEDGKVKQMDKIEREAIALVLKRENGCMARASRLLGIGRSTLYRKLDGMENEPLVQKAG